MTVQTLSTFIRGNLWQENPTPKKMKSLKYRLKKHEVTITVSELPRVLVLQLRWFGIYYCHLLLLMLWYCDIDIVALPSVFHNTLTSLMSARRCCVGNFTATQFEHLLDVLTRPDESRRPQLQLFSMSWPKPRAVSTLLVTFPIKSTIISAADWDLAPGHCWAPVMPCDGVSLYFFKLLDSCMWVEYTWSMHTVGVYTIIKGLFLLIFLVPMLYNRIASFRNVFKLLSIIIVYWWGQWSKCQCSKCILGWSIP